MNCGVIQKQGNSRSSKCEAEVCIQYFKYDEVNGIVQNRIINILFIDQNEKNLDQSRNKT